MNIRFLASLILLSIATNFTLQGNIPHAFIIDWKPCDHGIRSVRHKVPSFNQATFAFDKPNGVTVEFEDNFFNFLRLSLQSVETAKKIVGQRIELFKTFAKFQSRVQVKPLPNSISKNTTRDMNFHSSFSRERVQNLLDETNRYFDPQYKSQQELALQKAQTQAKSGAHLFITEWIEPKQTNSSRRSGGITGTLTFDKMLTDDLIEKHICFLKKNLAARCIWKKTTNEFMFVTSHSKQSFEKLITRADRYFNTPEGIAEQQAQEKAQAKQKADENAKRLEQEMQEKKLSEEKRLKYEQWKIANSTCNLNMHDNDSNSYYVQQLPIDFQVSCSNSLNESGQVAGESGSTAAIWDSVKGIKKCPYINKCMIVNGTTHPQTKTFAGGINELGNLAINCLNGGNNSRVAFWNTKTNEVICGPLGDSQSIDDDNKILLGCTYIWNPNSNILELLHKTGTQFNYKPYSFPQKFHIFDFNKQGTALLSSEIGMSVYKNGNNFPIISSPKAKLNNNDEIIDIIDNCIVIQKLNSNVRSSESIFKTIQWMEGYDAISKSYGAQFLTKIDEIQMNAMFKVLQFNCAGQILIELSWPESYLDPINNDPKRLSKHPKPCTRHTTTKKCFFLLTPKIISVQR